VNNNSFQFMPAPWIPFKDKEVLERVRRIKRKDMEKHSNPDFKIKIVSDVGIRRPGQKARYDHAKPLPCRVFGRSRTD